MKYLIAGLGNIGAEYELTRHNIGFLVLDQLAGDRDFEQGRHAFVREMKHKGRTLHLVKPATYMNLSGKAVRYYMKALKISKENTLVITDDIALPFGKIRMRKRGSAGGHNGLKSIEEMTGGQDYARLRFGVGDDFPKDGQTDYVLSRFNAKQTEDLPRCIHRAVQAAVAFATIGIERAMNQYNG